MKHRKKHAPTYTLSLMISLVSYENSQSDAFAKHSEIPTDGWCLSFESFMRCWCTPSVVHSDV